MSGRTAKLLRRVALRERIPFRWLKRKYNRQPRHSKREYRLAALQAA